MKATLLSASEQTASRAPLVRSVLAVGPLLEEAAWIVNHASRSSIEDRGLIIARGKAWAREEGRGRARVRVTFQLVPSLDE